MYNKYTNVLIFINMSLKESIRRILKEERNISDIIKIAAKEYNCSTWEINNGYCEDFALNVLEKLGGYEDNLFELSGDMFFNQRDPEFAKENWGDVIETNYGVWSKNLLDYWGYPPNVNLNLVDDEINHVWLFYNGKHYDAEVPEGVDNWFEIPLIKRLFNRYKKNMVQESIRRILREIEEDRVQIRLGRNAERHFGTVQNIIISLDGEDITSEDDVPGLGKMNIVIKDGEIIVGDIFIPEKYRRKGIATVVYQKISDYFGLPIVSSTIKGFNQTKEGGYIWKNRDNFKPRNLQESIRRILKEETGPKKEGLLNIIQEDGLYNFTKDTGLSYNDIYHRMGQLPRDVKIQYLKDVINDLEQSPGELDLTFITGSIPLYENDDWQMVYVEYLTNDDNVLRVHLTTFDDDNRDEYDSIHEDDIDYETLDTLVSELSEKLQHKRM